MGFWGIGVTATTCPFYIRESEKEITCEGADMGTKCSKKFNSRKDKENFQKHHCFTGCDRCHNAKILLK